MLIGDTVKIIKGPLVGRIARCTGVSGERVSIMLDLDGRQVELEIDLTWIEKNGI